MPTELKTKYPELKRKPVCWRGTFCGWFYRWNHWGIQIGISVQWRDQFTVRIADGITDIMSLSVIPSVKSEYITTLPILSPPISPFSSSSQLSPPKLQTTTPPKKSPFSQHKSYFFKFCGHNIRILIYCGFYHFL